MARGLIWAALAASLLAAPLAGAVEVPTKAELAAEIANLQAQIDAVKAVLAGAGGPDPAVLEAALAQAWVDLADLELRLAANDARLRALEAGGP